MPRVLVLFQFLFVPQLDFWRKSFGMGLGTLGFARAATNASARILRNRAGAWKILARVCLGRSMCLLGFTGLLLGSIRGFGSCINWRYVRLNAFDTTCNRLMSFLPKRLLQNVSKPLRDRKSTRLNSSHT